MKKWIFASITLIVAALLVGFIYVKEKRNESKTEAKTGGVPILMYHSISTPGPEVDEGSKKWFVSEENFEAQMKHLKEEGYTLLTFEEIEDTKKYKKPIFVTLDDGYKDNMRAFEILKELEDETFKPKATVFMTAAQVGLKNFLTAEQLKEMSDSGIISVQSHTVSHPDLTLDNINYEEELKQSKEKLEAITNKPIDTLAYPYGMFNEKAIEETKKYYKHAVIIGDIRFQLKNEPNELYTLERLTVAWEDSLSKFKSMVR